MAMKHSIARTLVKYVSKKPHGMLVSASALIVAIASLAEARAAGETVGYSAPFLFAQFEVILQDRTATEAKKAGLNLLNPTNADNNSGKQITDVRNLVPLHRGFDGLKFNGGLGGPRARPESQCCARRPRSA